MKVQNVRAKDGKAVAFRSVLVPPYVRKARSIEAALSRLDAIRQIGVVEQTYYRWKKKYGGMGADQLRDLKRLQKENERLRRAVSDLTLDKLILTEAAKGNY